MLSGILSTKLDSISKDEPILKERTIYINKILLWWARIHTSLAIAATIVSTPE